MGSSRTIKADTRIIAATNRNLEEEVKKGNFRELENVLERAVIASSGPELRLADEFKKSEKDLSISQTTLSAVERNHIIRLEQYRLGMEFTSADTYSHSDKAIKTELPEKGHI